MILADIPSEFGFSQPFDSSLCEVFHSAKAFKKRPGVDNEPFGKRRPIKWRQAQLSRNHFPGFVSVHTGYLTLNGEPGNSGLTGLVDCPYGTDADADDQA